MELELEGVGALPDLKMKIDGLTVILGENGVGKSTVLKSLYSIVKTSSSFEKEKRKDISESLRILYDMIDPGSGYKAGRDVDWTDALERVTSSDLFMNSPDIRERVDVIRELIDGSSDTHYAELLMERNLSEEFVKVRQVCDLRNESSASIRIVGDYGTVEVMVNREGRVGWSGPIKGQSSSVMYYDSPFVVDGFPAEAENGGHREDLRRMLRYRSVNIVDRMTYEKRTVRLREAIKEVLDGDFVRSDDGDEYITRDGIRIKESNMSAGIRIFAALKILIDNGCLSTGSLVLLDEPEVHLHPGWQNILAGIIVLLAKDIGARVVMTTHSPQLLLALQGYSFKYLQDAKFYELRRDDEDMVLFKDLNNDLSEVFSDMADRFEEADNIYWDNYGGVE